MTPAQKKHIFEHLFPQWIFMHNSTGLSLDTFEMYDYYTSNWRRYTHTLQYFTMLSGIDNLSALGTASGCRSSLSGLALKY